MPTYEYRCPKGHEFELFQRMSDEPKAKCPTCGAKAKRILSAGAGFLFKGGGFYKTDYRSDDYHAAAKKDSEQGKPAADGAKSDSSPSDGKKADAPTTPTESKPVEPKKSASDTKPKKKSKG